MPKSHWLLVSTHSTFNLIGPSPCSTHTKTEGFKDTYVRPLTYELFFKITL